VELDRRPRGEQKVVPLGLARAAEELETLMLEEDRVG